MAKVTFNAEFGGGLTINQYGTIRDNGVRTTGRIHRLSPKQFDALVAAARRHQTEREQTYREQALKPLAQDTLRPGEGDDVVDG